MRIYSLKIETVSYLGDVDLQVIIDSNLTFISNS